MKYSTLMILLSALLFLMYISLEAQQLPRTWGVRGGGLAIDHALAVTVDTQDNLYITGGLQAADYGNTDIFLSKYTIEGQQIWNISAGSDTVLHNTFAEYGTDVLAIGEYVYVTGTFMSKADFSGFWVKSRGYEDIFLAKYSALGNLIWVRSAGGESQDLVHSMAADKEGNVYITGSFQRQARFENKTLMARNSTDMFYAKFDPQGNLVWAQQAGSVIEGIGKKIRCLEDHCLIAGEYSGAVEFESMVVADEENKVMLTTIDQSNGVVLDNKIMFSQSDVTVNDFIVENGCIYMTGSFFQTLTFSDTSIVSRGGTDGYLVKQDASGKKLWARGYGGPYFDKGQSLTSDKKGIMLTGSFQKELQMTDSLILGFDADDIFMATITSQGLVSEVEVFGGPGSDNANDSEMLDGSLVIAGYFRDIARIRDLTLQSAGSSDIMLAKLQLTSDKVKPLSLSEPETIVKVYPNPADGKFIVSALCDLGEIGVSNMLGQTIANVTITRLNSRDVEIRIGGDFHGICIVKGNVGKERFIHKVIIE